VSTLRGNHVTSCVPTSFYLSSRGTDIGGMRTSGADGFGAAAPSRIAATTTKKDTSVTFWAERIFFGHTYDTSMTIIVTKPGIIIDVVGSYFYDKKS